jgi:hypothetical protein
MGGLPFFFGCSLQMPRLLNRHRGTNGRGKGKTSVLRLPLRSRYSSRMQR